MWALIYVALCVLWHTFAHPLENDQAGTTSSSLRLQVPTRNGTVSYSSTTPSSTRPVSTSSPSFVPPNGAQPGFPTGNKVGTAVGGGVGGLAILTLVVCWVLRRRQLAKRRAAAASIVEDVSSGENSRLEKPDQAVRSTATGPNEPMNERSRVARRPVSL